MDGQGLMVLLSSVAFWLLASLVVGLVANRLPERWLQGREASGVVRRRWPSTPGPSAVRIWKRWIPDAGGVLPGGVRKASLVRRDPAALRRLVLETRRAELVHWALWPAALLTALWLPPPALLVNLAFACLFNLPCLRVQRYNRWRLLRCLDRMQS